jgi:hypothetical protein
MMYDRTNITKKKLDTLDDIIREEREDSFGGIKLDGVELKTTMYDYMFAPQQDDSMCIEIPAPAGIHIQVYLDSKRYGQIDGDLSNKLANIVAKVNDAHEYDFGKCIEAQIKSYERRSIKKEVLLNEMAAILKYAPDMAPDNDKPRIICTDSTRMIADELEKSELPIYWKIGTVVRQNGIQHSVIHVFDSKGGWVTLNGKTPANDYKILPKENLDEARKIY